MPIISDKELPEDARVLWLKARSAVELRNYGYAISLIGTVLKKCPSFLDGRKLLRITEIHSTKGKKSFLSGLSTASIRGQSTMKKDPVAAMELAEKILESDPFNAQGNHLLKDSARAAGYPEIAAFALETLIEGNPKDTKVLHELGELYTAMGDADKAVKVYTRIVDINPADLIAVKRSKDAAASATIKQGGWEKVGDFTGKLKDAEAATKLEQGGRGFKDEASIDAEMAELGAQYEQQPENMEIVRRIALLSEQKQNLTNSLDDIADAVKWFVYANDLTKGADPQIARKLSDLEMRSRDLHIKSLQDWFEAGGEQHEDAGVYRDELNRLIRERAETQIGDAKRRVDRNPTDLQLRYELGERLMQAGQYTEAIPELQRSKQNPNVRLKSMNLLGQCFSEKGMLDMAVTQFKTAASELLAMDNTKKEILYKLGLVHEKLGHAAEYLNCMKEIYEVDYNYLDVAKRVEGSYGTNGAA